MIKINHKPSSICLLCYVYHTGRNQIHKQTYLQKHTNTHRPLNLDRKVLRHSFSLNRVQKINTMGFSRHVLPFNFETIIRMVKVRLLVCVCVCWAPHIVVITHYLHLHLHTARPTQPHTTHTHTHTIVAS